MPTHLLDKKLYVIILYKVFNRGMLSWMQNDQQPEFSLQALHACGQSHDVHSFSSLGGRQEKDHIFFETINAQTSPEQVLQSSEVWGNSGAPHMNLRRLLCFYWVVTTPSLPVDVLLWQSGFVSSMYASYSSFNKETFGGSRKSREELASCLPCHLIDLPSLSFPFCDQTMITF